MEECTVERKKRNRQTLPGMPRKIEKGACQDSSGVALFMTAEGALHWAYAVSSMPIVHMSAINSMRMNARFGVKSNTLITDLTAQDRHGQAALIIGLIDRVHDPVGREYIKARFGRKTDPADLLCLVDFCAGGLRMEGKKEGVYHVLKYHFTGNASIRTVRREIGCRHHSAAVMRERLFTALEHLDLRSMSELRGILEERGLVQTSRSG